MKKLIILTALLISNSVFANYTKDSTNDLYDISEYIMNSSSTTENYAIYLSKLTNWSAAKRLKSKSKIKLAFAQCIFDDAAYTEWQDSFPAANDLWKQLRGQIKNSELEVYRISTKYNYQRVIDTVSESCGVMGPSCSVVFKYRGSNTVLTASGDTCQ